MTQDISHTEASLALEAVGRRRREVQGEIDVPWWYWPVLASGWAGLGLLNDYGPGWVSAIVTVLFGAAHASIGRWALSGRHGSPRVSVRNDAVGRWTPLLIIGFLLIMTVITIAIALVLNADGARHPAALAGFAVGGLVLFAGPNLMVWIRAWAQRRAAG